MTAVQIRLDKQVELLSELTGHTWSWKRCINPRYATLWCNGSGYGYGMKTCNAMNHYLAGMLTAIRFAHELKRKEVRS